MNCTNHIRLLNSTPFYSLKREVSPLRWSTSVISQPFLSSKYIPFYPRLPILLKTSKLQPFMSSLLIILRSLTFFLYVLEHGNCLTALVPSNIFLNILALFLRLMGPGLSMHSQRNSDKKVLQFSVSLGYPVSQKIVEFYFLIIVSLATHTSSIASALFSSTSRLNYN